jgi:hemoglobin-like flavoprotein
LVRETFETVKSQAGIAAMVFYQNLFTLDPSLRSMFQTSIELQGRKLMESLEFTVAMLEQPERLVPELEAMGRRHVSYGTQDVHYETVVRAMLLALRTCLLKKWTSEVESAWTSALEFVAEAMKRGAKQTQELLAAPAGRGGAGKCPFGH